MGGVPGARRLEVLQGGGAGASGERRDIHAHAVSREVIEAQQSLLAELSTPLIPIREGVVVMPLIGAMNAERAGQMLESLLKGVMTRRSLREGIEYAEEVTGRRPARSS